MSDTLHPTTFRLPQNFLDHCDRIADALNKSNLGDRQYCRNDIAYMIFNHHIKKVYGNPISNEIFEMIFNNLDDPDIIDAHTVRGIAKKISDKDVDQDFFEKIAGCL